MKKAFPGAPRVRLPIEQPSLGPRRAGVGGWLDEERVVRHCMAPVAPLLGRELEGEEAVDVEAAAVESAATESRLAKERFRAAGKAVLRRVLKVRPYALHWLETYQQAVCAPGGKGRKRDLEAFETEFGA